MAALFFESMQIKFNNIQDLNDARYASAALSEWVGFGLNELPIGKVQEIIGWCAGPKLTLELNRVHSIETAQSWCNLLPVNALECPSSDFEYWFNHMVDAGKYEWIIASDTVEDFQTLSNKHSLTAVFHLKTQSLSETSKEIAKWNSMPVTNNNLLVNVSEWLNQPSEITQLNAPGLSIDCYPETTLGLKNYDYTNQLFELLDIF